MDINAPATKKDIIELRNDIIELKTDNQKLDTKLDKLQNTLDKFVGIADNLRDENTIGAHHTRELQIRVDDHEKRLRQVEPSKQQM